MQMKCGLKARAIVAPANLLSRTFATSAQRSEHSRVRVPCNSNGSIDLDIYCSGKGSSTACLYLPRGPISNHPEEDALNVSALQCTLECPVVKVSYRHGIEHRHPQPVFDVAAGYDWVVQNILKCTTSYRYGRGPTGKVAVCGELFGGSLATTLALTECRADEPVAVVAAAVNNAVFDWVDLEKYLISSLSLETSENSRIDVKELCRQRSMLFRRPEDYFDPFASPALFFRAAGSKIPSPALQLDEMEELAQAEREEYLQSQAVIGSIVNQAMSAAAVESTRKSSRRFPSKSLALRLPRFNISVGADTRLSDQAAELSRLLLKALERQQKTKPPRGWRGTKLAEATGDGMVVHRAVTGFGLWDKSTAGRTRMHDTAVWLNEALHG